MTTRRLTLGGSPITLTQSEHLIAVRPRDRAPGALEAAGFQTARAVGGAFTTLGGFVLVDTRTVGHSITPGPASALAMATASEAIDSAVGVYHTSADGVPFVPTGELFLRFRPDVPTDARTDLLAAHGLRIVEERGTDLIVATSTTEFDGVILAERLAADPRVEVVEPELATPPARRAGPPSDPLLQRQWHLKNRGDRVGLRAGADARVVDAWGLPCGLGSASVVVAVIDDGFDLDHPDIKGDGERIVHPYDFTRDGTDPSPDEGDWHGTACAGVAVGAANGRNIVGAAPASRLMPVRWGRDLSDREIERWFGWVTAHGADVVSCSWGALAAYFPLSTRARAAIARCAREGRGGKGAVICFAAGNSNHDVNNPAGGTLDGFATHPDVIAVAASTCVDTRAPYSNFGSEIWVCAPSSGGPHGVVTADVTDKAVAGHTVLRGYVYGDVTQDFGGTSSACPLVAGICALLLAAEPDLAPRQVRERLRAGARKIGQAADYDANGHSRFYGYGCVDAAATMTASASPAIQPLWGDQGHRLVNSTPITLLPEPLRGFFERYASVIEGKAMDPDHAKPSDPSEATRHFIDIDLYGPWPFDELPVSFADAVARYGEATVIGRGTLPWRITEVYQQLAEAFRSGDRDLILERAAWLGHYVGDAHVPFHTTANHDGQLTGQKGLHSYFETKVLKGTVRAEDVAPASLEHPGPDILAAAFAWVRESNLFAEPIARVDLTLGGPARRADRLPDFRRVAVPLAIDRLERGSARLAGAWLAAWEAAGRPSLPN